MIQRDTSENRMYFSPTEAATQYLNAMIMLYYTSYCSEQLFYTTAQTCAVTLYHQVFFCMFSRVGST